MGHTLVMGRTTYESIGRPLPGPHHDRAHPRPVVVGRGRARRRTRLDDALALAADAARRRDGRRRRAGLRRRAAVATEQVISEVPLAPEGDVLYPAFDAADWVETVREVYDGLRAGAAGAGRRRCNAG